MNGIFYLRPYPDLPNQYLIWAGNVIRPESLHGCEQYRSRCFWLGAAGDDEA